MAGQELSQRYPGDQADVGRGQQFLGGDLPQLGDPPGEPPVGPALAAAQVDGAGGLDIPLGVEEQDHDLGEDAAIEVDQRRVVDDLVGDAGLGIGGDFQDVEVGFGLPVSGPRSGRRAAGGTGPARLEAVARRRWHGTPRVHLGHVVPGVSKILLIRATAQEDRFHNSGELRVYREAQTDIPDPLFIPDKSAWPRLPSRLPWPRLQPMVRMERPDSGARIHRMPTGPAP